MEQIGRIAKLINSLGLADIKEEDYPILLETLDKDKDGNFDYSDFVAGIPMINSDPILDGRERKGDVIMLERDTFEDLKPSADN